VDESEQKLLGGLMRSGAKFILRFLDRDLFPSGKNYFSERKPQAKGVTPVVIHNNYIVGAQAKIDRFRNENLWYIDDVDFQCKRIVCSK
jgi:hypothetical protein